MQLADIICCGNHAYTDILRKTWQDELNSYSIVVSIHQVIDQEKEEDIE